MAEVQETNGNYQCPEEGCEDVFTKRLELHHHLFYVHKKVEPECPICQMKFSSVRRLRIHEKTHGEYSCEICGQKFNEKHYLKGHLHKHKVNRDEFKCSMCNKTFFYKGNLTVHFKNKHMNEKFKCLNCDKELSSKQKLEDHMMRKHKKNNKDIVISLEELESISSDEENSYYETDQYDFKNEFTVKFEDQIDEHDEEFEDQEIDHNSNFFLKKQESVNDELPFNLSKEDLDLLLEGNLCE